MSNTTIGVDVFLEKLKEEDDIAHYLISNPFSFVNNCNYDETLTEDIFYQSFYVNSNPLENTQKEIIKYLKSISKNTIFITGYKGCGKTTFINYAIKEIEKSLNTKNKICNLNIIDFEQESTETKQPFNFCLLKKMKDVIHNVFKEINNFDIFTDPYINNMVLFNDIENESEFSDFFSIFPNKNINKSTSIENSLFCQLKKMSISEILIILCYFKICINNEKGINSFNELFCFDNIDDVNDCKDVGIFIEQYKLFIEKASVLISKLRFTNGKHYNLYENFSFIFCVRDTTVAKFSAHFTDRAIDFYHRDISDMIDKESVINKKVDYLKRVDNIPLYTQAELLRSIATEPYIKENIFPLFNNDFRTAIRSFTNIISENPTLVKSYKELILKDDKKAYFGAHGVIIRLILNSFIKQGYFNLIGIRGNNCQYNYSFPRIILTYLYNFQEYFQDRFLNNDDNSIDMKQIYDSFHEVIPKNFLAEKLCSMYLLHEKKDWNHLINIDAPYEMVKTNLESIFNKYKETNKATFEEGDGKIRITLAGRVFVRIICTHYEYFSSRYLEGSYPLFSDENFLTEGKYDKEKFLSLLSTVFSSVESCCIKSSKFDDEIYGKYIDNIKNNKKNPYIYKSSKTHVERVINHHISYLDAYRLYILERPDLLHKAEICKYIISTIKDYVSLLDRFKTSISSNTIELLTLYHTNIDNIGNNFLSEKPISWGLNVGE